MYEELVDRLRNLSHFEVRNAESVIHVSAEAVTELREIAHQAADAIEELSKQLTITPSDSTYRRALYLLDAAYRLLEKQAQSRYVLNLLETTVDYDDADCEMASFFDGYGGCCTCTREKCSDECATYRRFKPKPITNSMRIRTMTDEELAKVMSDDCDLCIDRISGVSHNCRSSCYECWIDWLKQEATE